MISVNDNGDRVLVTRSCHTGKGIESTGNSLISSDQLWESRVLGTLRQHINRFLVGPYGSETPSVSDGCLSISQDHS